MATLSMLVQQLFNGDRERDEMSDDKALSDTPRYAAATTLWRLSESYRIACPKENFWDFVDEFRDIAVFDDEMTEQSVGAVLKAAADKKNFKKIPSYFYSLIVSLALCRMAIKKEEENLLPQAWDAAINASFHAGQVFAVTQTNVMTASEFASLAGKRAVSVQLAKDPKQTGKSFVFQCWQVWQEEPEKYKDKTDFAKKMLKQDQCTALESQKVITDWCRLWEKAHPAS